MNLSRNVTKRPTDDKTINEETFPAAEKILSDIENVLRKDHELSSFEIIPIEDSENKSPVYHEEHSLGLASWCVRPLYIYAYRRLFSARQAESRRGEDISSISRWLNGALLLNPDVTTFWNMKREYVTSGRLEPLDELRFTSIILYAKAKCIDCFSYRRWLLQHLLKNYKKPSSNLSFESLLKSEIEIAAIAASRYASNYHAWNHREYVINLAETNFPNLYESLLTSEWEKSKNFSSTHLSDHSGHSYRQFLLKRFLFRKIDDNYLKERFTPEEIEIRREIVKNYVFDGKSALPTARSVKQGATLPVELPAKQGASVEEEVSVKKDDSRDFLGLVHGVEVGKTERQESFEVTLARLSYWIEECKNNDELLDMFPEHEALWYHRRFLAFALYFIDYSYGKIGRYGSELPTIRLKNFDKNDGDFSDSDNRINRGFIVDVFLQDNQRLVGKIEARMKYGKSLGDKFLNYVRPFFGEN